MNLADALRGLWRRWKIVVPGLILTIVLAIAAWQIIGPSYERTATQLLLPGPASIPVAGNPYLYLGGVSPAADVLITAMSSVHELDALLKGHPGAEIAIARDHLSAGPQILTTVTARSDAEASTILDATISRTTEVLGNLQNVNGITADNRIGITLVTVDNRSTLIQRTRGLAAAGVALGMLLITLLTAGLVDGLSTRKRRRASAKPRTTELNGRDRRVQYRPLTRRRRTHRGSR